MMDGYLWTYSAFQSRNYQVHKVSQQNHPPKIVVVSQLHSDVELTNKTFICLANKPFTRGRKGHFALQVFTAAFTRLS